MAQVSAPGWLVRFQRSRPAFFLPAVVIAWLAALGPAHAGLPETSARSEVASVEDVLRNEGMGMAAFSPDGRWLAYNLLPPYRELGDYSYWVKAGGLSGHRLWVKDLEAGTDGRLQPGLDPGATNFLFGYSPDSAHVVALEHVMGRLRLVSCRIGSDACSHFSAMPDIRDRYVSSGPWNERLVWTSDHTFVMPTRRFDQPGSEMRSRATTGRYLWEQWQSAWSGDGTTASEVISTSRDTSEAWDTGALVTFDVRIGTEAVLSPGRFAGVRISPDGVWLVAARAGRRQRPPADAALVPAQTHPMFDRRYQLSLIHADTGETRTLDTPFNIDPHSLTWKGDSQKVSVFGWNEHQTPGQGRFYILTIATGKVRAVNTEGYVLAGSRYREEGRNDRGPARSALLESGLAAFARPAGESQYDWYLFSEEGAARNLSRDLEPEAEDFLHGNKHSISVLSRSGLYTLSAGELNLVYPPKEGRVLKPLAYRPNLPHGWSNEFRFDAARVRNDFGEGGAVVEVTYDGSSDTAIVFFEGDRPRTQIARLDVPVPGARVLAASGRARAALVSVKSGAASRLFLIRDDARPELIADLNTHLNDLTHPEVRTLEYELKDSEGAVRRMTTCIFLPPEFIADGSYPLLLEVYPIGVPLSCNTLADVPAIGAAVADMWSARGFVYVRPPVPLDIAATSDGPIAGIPLILEQTIDALAAQNLIDPDKVVLFGYSQGAVVALYTAAKSRRIALVIAMNGWSDFLSHYFGGRGLMRYFHLDENGGDDRWRYECALAGVDHRCPFGFGATPLRNPAIYAKNSPVVLAEQISAPVLLVHSDLDYVDISQFDEMFAALFRAGKEARYVRYWGEGHGVSSPSNIRDLWNRIDQFLFEHNFPKDLESGDGSELREEAVTADLGPPTQRLNPGGR